MITARQKYEKRERKYDALLHKQKSADRKISNLRLIVFIAGACAAIMAYLSRSYIVFTAILALFAGIFIYLVFYQEKLINRMKYTRLLLDISSTSLKRLNGEWHTFADSGEEFSNENHSFSSDLDIFGVGSLFQWISAAKTFIGRETLRNLLSGSQENVTDIHERQEAIDELAMLLNWRQRFLAEGMMTTKRINDPGELINWGKQSNEVFLQPWVITIYRICPVITILLATAGFFMNIIPKYIPEIALLIQFAAIYYKIKDRYSMFAMLENYNKDLKVYYEMLKHFEKRTFKSTLINKIKDNIKSMSGTEAFRQIDKLSSIVDSVNNRRNVFYIIYNTLTLWDFQCIIALEKWKRESGHQLKMWFDAIGKIEALASLSVIRFENPDWAMPILKDGTEAMLEARGMGHPLLGENRVHNDLTINEKVKVLLITGSNMSGKSTLLRTAGINLVLAYAGAPVCAKAFEASMMEVYTCMRIKDKLEENISSFYAELLRIKSIVKEAESGKRIFFLLDEIFKGTNSEDRHTGARVLINKLSLTKAAGMVSTHDLELCDLEQKNGKIANYHFQEYFENGEIHFDYKLRQGPSTTRNALHLMRLAGIEVGEDNVHLMKRDSDE